MYDFEATHFLPRLYVLHNWMVWFTLNCPSDMHRESLHTTVFLIHKWRPCRIGDLHKMIFFHINVIRLRPQHLVITYVPMLLNWVSVYLGNWIYLFVAVVSGISAEQDACTWVFLLQSLYRCLILRMHINKALGDGREGVPTEAASSSCPNGFRHASHLISTGPDQAASPRAIKMVCKLGR